MPIVPPDRLATRLSSLWYKTDEEMHQPIMDWLQQSGTQPHIENFLSRMLAKAGAEVTKREVPKRTMFVKISISMQKAALAFYNDLVRRSPQIEKQLQPAHLQMIMEMLLENTGYDVHDGVLTFEHNVPPLRENPNATPPTPPVDPEEEQIRAILSDDANANANADANADDEDEDDEDDEGEGDDEDEAEAVDQFEESPIEIGQIYGNGNGIHRRVDAMEGGRVSYTVTQGAGSVKEGQTNACAYKSFVTWAREKVEVPATA